MVKNLPANAGDQGFDPWSGKIPRTVCPWDSPGKRTGVGCHLEVNKPSERTCFGVEDIEEERTK